MDPLTHGLLGTVTAGLLSREKQKENRWPILVAGGAGALAPDLDVLIHSASDPLLQLEFHRFFTHSLLFAPFGAVFVSGILWLFLKNRLSFVTIWSFTLIGMLTSGVADAFTSYGTQLLWPFSDERIAWNLVSVFDPLFTVGILGGFLWSVISKHKKGFFLSIVWALLYLNWAAWNHNRVKSEIINLADSRGHLPVSYLLAKPTIANNWLWSGKYVADDVLYTAGFHLLPWSEIKVYEGEDTPLLDVSNFLSTTPELDDLQVNDIERFSVLSEGILIEHPEDSLLIGDGRYAMLPTSVKPLWGIRLKPKQPESHVVFEEFRSTDPEIVNRFKEMLMGR